MIRLTGTDLGLEVFGRVVGGGVRCDLSSEARGRVEAGRRTIEEVVASGEPVYGVNTGFGRLSNQRIPQSQLQELQLRLLLSHAAGVGRPLPDRVVRGMLVLRANTLARGFSGVRPVVIERLLVMLNEDVLPVVPSRGSVGASGDLAPLAHLALPLIGRGRVRERGAERDAADVLGELGLEPLVLQPKEGLALVNGTQAMTSLVGIAALGARDLVLQADLIGALSTDAYRGSDEPFDERLHRLRPHPGQMASAANLWSLLQGSQIRESHRTGDRRVQDPYSLRCMPEVHGAVRDALTDVERRLEIEMNSVTDNPLVFSDSGEVVVGGNFHGEPMAMAADMLAIALAELGGISERRIDKLTNPDFSQLPAFLIEDSGLKSGFMMAQVTAAALASENKTLAHPASVDSIPTSAEKEDHVSMGMGAALRLARCVRNVRRILAIELLCGAQALEFHRPLRSSERLEAMVAGLRERVARWDESHEMARDLDGAYEFLGARPAGFVEDLL
ncbi:MAG: histidine ammonia-lyase [Acidobacteriota bacterium]|nr:histidine ammonia-lyase [Acidobacteriota bacterium]